MEYWHRENHDRPIIGMDAIDETKPVRRVEAPNGLYERWTDIHYVIDRYRSFMERALYVGDTFPAISPDLGPDFLGATFGTDIVFERDTSYSVPVIKDWSQTDGIRFSADNKWWKMMVGMTRALADDSKGDYAVGITDLHPGFDGVVSLRGAENTCMDMFDNPEAVAQMAQKLSAAFEYALKALHAIASANGTGCTNWSGIWREDLWYITSCDFICMISQDMFCEYVAPVIEAEAKALKGNAIFHLDGPGALKHLDTLLDIPQISGIQWVYGAGQPSAMYWLDALKKIQTKNKLIQVNVQPEDIPVLTEQLKPEGLFLNCEFTPSLEQAQEILRIIERR
jgi:hypothetical protein